MGDTINKIDASDGHDDLSEKYIGRILEAYNALKSLMPFDTAAKIEEAVPWWQALYDVLAFTSVNHVTESLVGVKPMAASRGDWIGSRRRTDLKR